jgi:hypothetical protein
MQEEFLRQLKKPNKPKLSGAAGLQPLSGKQLREIYMPRREDVQRITKEEEIDDDVPESSHST